MKTIPTDEDILQEIMLAVGRSNFDVHSMSEQFYKPVRDPAADQLLPAE